MKWALLIFGLALASTVTLRGAFLEKQAIGRLGGSASATPSPLVSESATEPATKETIITINSTINSGTPIPITVLNSQASANTPSTSLSISSIDYQQLLNSQQAVLETTRATIYFLLIIIVAVLTIVTIAWVISLRSVRGQFKELQTSIEARTELALAASKLGPDIVSQLQVSKGDILRELENKAKSYEDRIGQSLSAAEDKAKSSEERIGQNLKATQDIRDEVGKRLANLTRQHIDTKGLADVAKPIIESLAAHFFDSKVVQTNADLTKKLDDYDQGVKSLKAEFASLQKDIKRKIHSPRTLSSKMTQVENLLNSLEGEQSRLRRELRDATYSLSSTTKPPEISQSGLASQSKTELPDSTANEELPIHTTKSTENITGSYPPDESSDDTSVKTMSGLASQSKTEVQGSTANDEVSTRMTKSPENITGSYPPDESSDNRSSKPLIDGTSTTEATS